ncbi:MAG: Holliday junction resolvase RuvX [Candidatus Kapaibacterium sp.]|nr:MAG: Holliday junction resolvase RuvX [Candidatus Kapabacteria bacterium]
MKAESSESRTIPALTRITPELRSMLAGKRIAAVDYGKKRVGFAVADELHILASPRGIFHNSPTLVEEILRACQSERCGAILVGMPLQHDDGITPMMQEIARFIGDLQSASAVPVLVIDEAYSSREARQSMIASGKKKRYRQTKGHADELAAAIILREFLRELE